MQYMDLCACDLSGFFGRHIHNICSVYRFLGFKLTQGNYFVFYLRMTCIATIAVKSVVTLGRQLPSARAVD